jgi:FixJ family two-component response regulator
MTPAPRIAVVDDDESVRESLPDLLRACGYAVTVFSSAEEFLASSFVGKTDCLILDIAMPGMDGLALQQELLNRRHSIPVVFITGTGDESIRLAALAAGAVDCLFKPFSESALLNAVTSALTVA